MVARQDIRRHEEASRRPDCTGDQHVVACSVALQVISKKGTQFGPRFNRDQPRQGLSASPGNLRDTDAECAQEGTPIPQYVAFPYQTSQNLLFQV